MWLGVRRQVNLVKFSPRLGVLATFSVSPNPTRCAGITNRCLPVHSRLTRSGDSISNGTCWKRALRRNLINMIAHHQLQIVIAAANKLPLEKRGTFLDRRCPAGAARQSFHWRGLRGGSAVGVDELAPPANGLMET